MRILLLSIFLSFLGCTTPSKVVSVESKLLRVEEKPEKEFYFPYYIYIPKSYIVNKSISVPLLVIPNNSGTVSNDFLFHEKRVIRDMERSSKDLAEMLGLPTLMPVFPRPRNIGNTYTHSLDRDTMEIKAGSLKRIDLQLISMVDDAKSLLKKRGIFIAEKFLMNGYSANGTFTNRFVFLHPHLILGVASGGVNGMPMLPLPSINNKNLPYPIGTSDIKELTGKPFDLDLYKKVPQLIYMGAKDSNDTLPYRDAFSEEEAGLIKKVLPKKMMPDRWEKSIAIYKQQNINARFKTYEEYGHEYTDQIRRDISEFFGGLY